MSDGRNDLMIFCGLAGLAETAIQDLQVRRWFISDETKKEKTIVSSKIVLWGSLTPVTIMAAAVWISWLQSDYSLGVNRRSYPAWKKGIQVLLNDGLT